MCLYDCLLVDTLFERLLAEISNAPSTRLVQLIYEESAHLRSQITKDPNADVLAAVSSSRGRFLHTTPSRDHQNSINSSTDSDRPLDTPISLQIYDVSSAWDFDKALFFCTTVVTTIVQDLDVGFSVDILAEVAQLHAFSVTVLTTKIGPHPPPSGFCRLSCATPSQKEITDAFMWPSSNKTPKKEGFHT
ncbi:unnamed protein product [Dibothriocephalus latus]|uniref:Uncharacterized protein n=1 Tax=Dibothriocephalus latus TaxID=60516 RepID=A0A3P6TKE8_DIBLA|nr:unnamed protein product [Dibothriocephalus latus]